MNNAISRVRKSQNLLLLTGLFLFALFFRIIFLDRIPNAIGGDELVYVLTAKAIALTGSDLTGSWNPLSAFMFHYPPGESQAELPYFLFLPVIGLTHFSLFTARFTNALMSALTVIVLFGIAQKLFNRNTAIVTALVASINPWFIYIGRTAYEVVPATFFYLLGLLILLTQTKKRLLWAIPILFAAFYSYIGTKVLFLPFVLVTAFYSWFIIHKKKNAGFFLVIIAAAILLVGAYMVALRDGTAARAGNLFLPDNVKVSTEVDAVRKESIQTPFLPLFDNKYTVYTRLLIKKMFDTISANYLFAAGDRFFSMYTQGPFYSIDALFLLVGLGSLLFFTPHVFTLVSTLMVVSIAPQLIFDSTSLFTPHIALLFPLIILCISAGIMRVIDMVPKKWTRPMSVLFIGIYALLCGCFLYIYTFQHSLQGHFDFSVRVLSRYIELANPSSQDISVYTKQPFDLYKKYLFYANGLSDSTALEVGKAFHTKDFTLGTVHFLTCDEFVDPEADNSRIIISDNTCNPLQKKLPSISVKQLKDAGDTFLVYNNHICDELTLKYYPSGITLDDFRIEQMETKRFCSTFLFRK